MNCSNCVEVIFDSEKNGTEEIMCENGHFLCAKCYALSKTRCIQCGGKLFDSIDSNTISQQSNKWIQHMISELMKIKGKPSPYALDFNIDEESELLKDPESINLLFSRSRSFDPDSEHNSSGINNSEYQSIKQNSIPNLNQNQGNIQNEDFFYQEELNSRCDENFKQKNLVDQLTEEIRGQLIEEVYSRLKDEPRTSIKPDQFMCVRELKTSRGSKEHLNEIMDLDLEPNYHHTEECHNINDNFFYQEQLSSRCVENLKPINRSLNQLQKNTRQNLADQLTEEIRQKLKEEIYSRFKDDPINSTNSMKGDQFVCVREFQTMGVSTEPTVSVSPTPRLYRESKESTMTNVFPSSQSCKESRESTMASYLPKSQSYKESKGPIVEMIDLEPNHPAEECYNTNDNFSYREQLSSRHVENFNTKELVDQLTEEIRGKIKDEIYSRFKDDPRTCIKPNQFMCIRECKTTGVSTEPKMSSVPTSQSCKESKEKTMPSFSTKSQSYKDSREQIVEVIDLKPKSFTKECHKINDDFFYQEQLNSRCVENLKPINQSLNLIRKNTRQSLTDQLTEEIREKLKEEIYSKFKDDPTNSIKGDQFMCVRECKTIGISSEPSVSVLPTPLPHRVSQEPTATSVLAKPQTYRESEEQIVEVIDLKPKNYTEVCHNTKLNKATMEQQQVNETGQEQGATAQETQDQRFMGMLKQKFAKMPPAKIEQLMSSLCNTEEGNVTEHNQSNQDDRTEKQTTPGFVLMSNSSRASYSPPTCFHDSTPPKPQFQFIATTTKPPAEIIDAASLSIPRSPIVCPISTCQKKCFVSYFSRHFAVDHNNVPMVRIDPRQYKNFFLDPKLIHFGSTRCQMLLLVKDKIKNLGHEKDFKDFIPVLVMSTKVRTLDLCCNQDTLARNKNDGFLMIWLVGLMPQEVPIYFSMTFWARTGNLPSCHIVHSGQLYSIRNSQDPKDIQESGQRLLLSRNQVDLLTDGGKNMLELQILVN